MDLSVNKTLGCRHNFYELQVVQGILQKHDMDGGFMVINTCTVTNESERQCRQTIRKMKKDNPERKLIVTGCASNLHAEKFIKMLEVDFVVSNEMKLKHDSYIKIKEFCKSGLTKESSEFGELHGFLTQSNYRPFNATIEPKDKRVNYIERFSNREQAYVAIQTGCDNFCSFCIIPFTRSRIQSMGVDAVLKQVELFVKNGYKQVVLTGTNIMKYGDDLDEDVNLAKLCNLIFKKTTIEQVMLSSLDVAEMDEEMIEVIGNKRLTPYLHLSLQSGNNEILKRMNRRHTREEAIAFCRKVLEIRPDMKFGADIITGFCGETEEQFMDSVNIIKECHISSVHAFPYSKKEGTLAARMDDNVPKEEKKRRVKVLQEFNN